MSVKENKTGLPLPGSNFSCIYLNIFYHILILTIVFALILHQPIKSIKIHHSFRFLRSPTFHYGKTTRN